MHGASRRFLVNQVLAIVRAGVYYAYLRQAKMEQASEGMSEGVKMRTCVYYSGTMALKCAVNPTEPCLTCSHYIQEKRG